MEILVIGAGPVGLITSVCLAEHGDKVYVHDLLSSKMKPLMEGKAPFFEPGLDDALANAVALGALVPVSDISHAFSSSDIIMVCVGTPSLDDGSVDLRQVRSACDDIGAELRKADGRKTIVIRSTVPPGTIRECGMRIAEISGKRTPEEFGIVANPEFLRQGDALEDFRGDPSVVIGAETRADILAMERLYGKAGKKIKVLPTKSAEMSKYVTNSFNATKVSFINEMGRICHAQGIDLNEISDAVFPGQRYLKAGAGFGGSCLEKDLRGVIDMARKGGVEARLLRTVVYANDAAHVEIIGSLDRRLRGLEGRRIGILGLSFKKGTDDIRNSPAIKIIRALLGRGASIRASDPRAMDAMKTVFSDIGYDPDPQRVVDWSEAVVILNDWDDFKSLDLDRVFVVDARPGKSK